MDLSSIQEGILFDIRDKALVESLASALPVLVLILDSDRRIVYANPRIMDMLNLSLSQARGLRPGDALRCENAHRDPGGCGCSDRCQNCGALLAILDAQNSRQSVRECRVVNEKGEAMDFRVWTGPFTYNGQSYTSLSLLDIANEKRREALERTFFHDLLNTASGVSGILDLMNRRITKNERNQELLNIAHQGAVQMIEEIRSARALTLAESDSLALEVKAVDVYPLARAVAESHCARSMESGIRVEVLADEEKLPVIATDPQLLTRVLANLVKNAVEASKSGDCVRIRLETNPDNDVIIEVHNAAVMPLKVQQQVFQRSFSTKGTGRGLGTYSVRLFTERYLGGTVCFSSREGEGTSFFIRLPRELQDVPDA